jgi:acetyl-CoA acyltransferase
LSSADLWVLGAAMTPFTRYGAELDLIDLAHRAATAALGDAAVAFPAVDVLTLGTAYEPNANPAQRLLRQLGQTGIPAYNVVNACATGAAALRVACLAVAAGEADIGLAVGAEKMGKAGLLGNAAKADRDGRRIFAPSGRYGSVLPVEGRLGTQTMPGIFSHASTEYALRHGVTFEQFARVAEKNHAHSTLNPLAQYQKAFSLDEIMAADTVAWPNTLLMCCPTGDGAAAVVVVSGERLRSLGVEQRRRAVKISASVMTTQPWTDADAVVYDINTVTRRAATRAYESAGVGPEDLDLVELHDCFASAELLHYDNLGLCEPGGAGAFIDSGAPWRDGRTPVNVSGGLLSKGHPIGATGLAGIYEVVTHLRGEAGARQIPDARVGLAHVLGLGSTCAVHILERAAA